MHGRDDDLAGEFEVHLTVRSDHAPDATLAGVAARHQLTFAQIELDRGTVASQPMFTGRGSGALWRLHELAGRWAEALRAAGLDVIRVKIEAAPWNTGVPQTDADALLAPPGRYFEHHVKLLLGAEALANLPGLVEPYGARVSRNARRRRDDGRHERFVTQRCWLMGRGTARRRLAGLVDTLTDHGYVLLAVEEEYVVYDDNLAVDAGWIEPQAIPDRDHRRSQGGPHE